MAGYGGDRISLGGILGNAFGTVGGHPLATLGVSFLIGVLPQQLLSYGLTGGVELDAAQLFETRGGILLYLALVAFSMFCSLVVQAMLVRITLAYSRREAVSLGRDLAAALSKLLPLLGLTILMTLSLGVATLLLLVPGIILYVVWSVAAPALVAEDLGVVEAFERSAALTKGNRWRIFGLLLVLVALLTIFVIVLGIIFFATGLAVDVQMSATGPFIGYIVISSIASTLMTALWGTLIASLYLELRTVKEGPVTDSLADVFA